MEFLYHPVSGESGYFCTEKEKILIDAIISDYSMNHIVHTSTDSRGGVDE